MSDEQTKNIQESAASNTRAPDKSSPEAPAKKVNRKTASKSPRGATAYVLTVLILLGFLLAGAWYSYEFYQKTSQHIASIQRSQTELVEKAQEFEDKVSQRMESVFEKQKEMADYVDVLREKNQYLRKDWLLMESEYLIQLANYRLLLERDINTAIVALESSDQRLRDTGDPGILGVRKEIAQAIQQLKQIPQADLAGMSLQLSAINKEIHKLPLTTLDPKSKQQQQQQDVNAGEKVETWAQLPSAIWKDLKGLVKIRDHEKPIEPMLAPKERFFLIENVRLQIEQARLALLSGQPEVYKERIATAINWIHEHFDNEAKLTQSTLASLTSLANEPIAPELPDIAYTYQALQKYRSSRENDSDRAPAKTVKKPTTQVN